MFKLADRVKETTLTQGTGSLQLAGSFGSFQTFSNGIGEGNSTFYTIENNSQFEIGIGTLTSNTLSRDIILSSSNNNEKIELSGVSIVFCTYPASKSVFTENGFIKSLDPQYSGIIFPDQTFLISASGLSAFTIPTGVINLHNGGNQNAQILQFDNTNYQSVITGPAPAENTNAQRLIIQGQRGSGNGEGGDVYFWAGDSDYNGGDIKIYAGDADSNVNGYGGYINIDAGNGYNQGGNISITAGNSTEQGGDVNLVAGYPNGKINLSSNNGSYHWILNADGTVSLPSNTLDAGQSSIDIKSSSYAELYFQSTEENFVNNPSFNSESYIWTAYDGSYIQNTRFSDGANPSWNYTWEFSNNGNLNLPHGKTINWGQNVDTLGPPVIGGANDRIRLWDFAGGGSNFNYAIGVEGNHMWFSMDVNDGTGGFKFYSRDNEILKISDDSKIVFPNNTTIATGTYDNNTGGYGGISLNCVVGYELNWQGGHLKSTYDDGNYTANILLDSPIEFPSNSNYNLQIDNSGITFTDGTTLNSANHDHSITNINGLQYQLDTKQPSGNYANVIHTHVASGITDFNNSVSGLLPVKNILAGSGIGIDSSSGNYTISVTGTFGLTSEEVDDRVSNLLVNGEYIELNYTDNSGTLTISATGLQPSGNYSLDGHTHSSNNITDFNSSVSGLLPITNILSNNNIIIENSGSTYTISNIDEIEEYSNPINLPASGNSDILYKTIDNSKLYQYIDSVYIEIGASASIENHTHVSNQITDFNTSVSGLLPVKNILGSGNTTVNSTSGVFTINSVGILSNPTGIFGATSITNIIQISQVNYDALGTYDPNTLYVING